MNTFIAFFRGINVGGNNILPMKELKTLLERIGCGNVRTYIQSGNVLLQIKEDRVENIRNKMSREIHKDFGFEPKVLLIEISEFRDAIEKNPFDTSEGKTVHFYFLESEPMNPDLGRLTAVKSASEEFKLHGKVFYLYAPEGIGRSKLAAKVEQSLGIPVTARNWNTVSKLLSMADE